MAAPIRVVRPAELVDADPTVGMRRLLAFAVEGLWVGLVHTDARAVSGWHHHGEHDTGIYLLTGGMRLDFGAGGSTSVEAGPGDFVHVPPWVVHREANPGTETATAVIARSGRGEPTVNVDGPDS